MHPVIVGSLLSGSASRRGQMLQMVCLAGVVAAATVAIHWPVLAAQAILFDDNQFLTDNRLVQNPSWASVGRFFTEVLEPSTVQGYYLPLSMTSLMLDYRMGGRADDLRVFHRTSLGLHVGSTILIMVLLYMMLGQPVVAAAIALLFGLHPLTVEPIAWVAERKTLLSTFFSLWCLLGYVQFTRRRSWVWLGVALVAQAAALLSKPTAAPLPLLLVLLDYWPLRRLTWRALWEKVPFFAISLLSGVVTLISHERTAGILAPTGSSLGKTPLIVCHLVMFYLGKLFWPTHLSTIYLLPEPVSLGNWTIALGVVGTGVLAAALLLSLRRTRAFAAGGAFFFVAILPTMGLVQYSWVTASDKYVYLPVVGLLMIAAWGLGLLWRPGRTDRAALRAAVMALVLALSVGEAYATRTYLTHWTDTVTHARYMLALAPQSAIAHNRLGDPLMKGDLDEAIEHFAEALRLQPDYLEARCNLGTALRLRGDIDEALPLLEQSVRDIPKNALAHYNLGLALHAKGRFDEAGGHLRAALALRPDDNAIRCSLGQTLLALGNLDEAAACFREVLRREPDQVESLVGLGGTLAAQGAGDEALRCLQRALEINPANPDAQTVLGGVLASQGRIAEAVSRFQQALTLKPDHDGAHYNMGLALQLEGKIDEAISHYRAALRSKPTFVEAHYALGLALVRAGQPGEAVVQLRAAAALRPDWVPPLLAAARLLAACSDASVRQEREAVGLAEHAAALTKYQDARVLDTLAVARAGVGDFDQAVTIAQRALALATAAKDDRLAAAITARLQLYQQRTPYVDPQRTAAESDAGG